MSGVDVLEVLDNTSTLIGLDGYNDSAALLREAHAAVAELIEAAKDAQAAMDDIGKIDRCIDYDRAAAAKIRIRAALAKVAP